MKLTSSTVALVTGAASGIGRETALALSAKGCKLILCDLDREGLASLGDEVSTEVLLAESVDVGDRAAMQAFAAAVHERVEAVDVIVNNAGIGMAGTLWSTPLDAWDRVLRVNLFGVLHGCHLFVPNMIERGAGGHVVNVSSGLGFFGAGGVNAYCTSKFAVYGMSECLRAELRLHKIGVSTICPGVIHTNIANVSKVYGEGENGEQIRQQLADAFRKRGYPPSKVAAAIVKGIRKNRGVVTVAPEAVSLYWLKRLWPGLAAWVGRGMEKRLGLATTGK